LARGRQTADQLLKKRLRLRSVKPDFDT
jgi:hypothetical protein